MVRKEVPPKHLFKKGDKFLDNHKIMTVTKVIRGYQGEENEYVIEIPADEKDFCYRIKLKESFLEGFQKLEGKKFEDPKIKRFGGEPCKHIGCMNHVTHPCEHCGRIGG